jgi:hypothetical protein
MKRCLLLTLLSIVGMVAGSAVRQASAHPGHTHNDGTPAPAVPAHLRAKIVQLNSGGFTIVRPPVAVAPDDEDEHTPETPLAAAAKTDETRSQESDAPACDDGNAAAGGASPAIHGHFTPFAKSLKLRWDEQFYYVGSNGMPDHPMMIGITAWQQQVPLPQKYFDDNAWRIPLHPVPAKEPAMIKGRFLRGAIALGVNGIPIFNPQNNRGDVSYEIGELDEWGGHCGRADDYHYHIVPVHLEKVVGKDRPVAYALDGYPIYGYQDEKAPDFAPLDRLSGHKDQDGNYHYHATKTYPYVIGGFYGEVVEREEQVDPQPRAQPVREYLPQMPGAKIVDFKSPGSGKYELKYEINGKPGYVRYAIAESGSVTFTFVDVDGRTKTETFEPGRRRPGGDGGGGKGGPGGDRRPPRPGENPPPRPGENRPPRPGDQPPPRPNEAAGDEPRGPKPGEARKPWIAEHFAELDADKNGRLTSEEMQAEATRTFAAYDTDGDGKLVRSEYDRDGVRTAFAGFVRGHSAEVDADADGTITKQELLDFAANLFEKADRNRDGSTDETEAGMGGPGGKKQ